MPAVSFLHSSTNGCKNELKSFGAFCQGASETGVDGQRINTSLVLGGESEICVIYYPASYQGSE